MKGNPYNKSAELKKTEFKTRIIITFGFFKSQGVEEESQYRIDETK